MLHFTPPEVEDFFDNRLIISWKISQPLGIPELKNLTCRISGIPSLIFDPLQSSTLEIPELNNNLIIINWIIRNPSTKTKITITVQNEHFFEEQNLVIKPEIHFNTDKN
ncbi:MAG: hypothetical protein ACXACR_05260 [Candidatus Hodarchaeales archaeon]